MPATYAVCGRYRPQQSAEQTIPGQLQLVGIRPREITHVNQLALPPRSLRRQQACNSCDHRVSSVRARCVEGARAAGTAGVLGHQLCAEASRTAPRLRIPGSPLTFTRRVLRRWREIRKLPKGSSCLKQSGTPPGHYSLMVKLAHRRPMLFTADCVLCAKEPGHDVCSGGNHDPARRFSRCSVCKTWRSKHDAELFFSHDPESWPGYRRGAAYYS